MYTTARLSGLLALLLFMACEPMEVDSVEQQPEVQEVVEESDGTTSGCLEPSAEFTEELRSFLTGGASFERIAAYRSGAHESVYYVAVHLEVPGADGWALFAATEIDRFAATYAVDDIANDFSNLLDGRRTQAAFSTRDPGAQEAIDCL